MLSGKMAVSAPLQSEFERLLSPSAVDALCAVSDGSNFYNSTNFRLTYNSIGGGLTYVDYWSALETTYSTEITSYGWNRP
jgi:hypothetical protein